MAAIKYLYLTGVIDQECTYNGNIALMLQEF